ncbi:MAG: sigma factor-like helix-turn-helix DNA-binding protein, partial [Nitrospiria bacterium]
LNQIDLIRSYKSDTEKLKLLRRRIVDKTSLLRISIELGVKPNILQRFMAREPLSQHLVVKIFQKLKDWTDSEEIFFLSVKVQRMLFVHQLYEKIGTLAGVGKEMGLSRERIRQLLRKGDELGLFVYQKRPKLDFLTLSKAKIIDDYRNLLQFQLVAKTNGISIHQFNRLTKHYQITRKQLKAIGKEGQQVKSILHYFSIFNKLGYHPSTSNLQKTNEGRYLSFKISKLWGSIHTFRKNLRIPFSAG